ncbi:hypothetical protein SAE01_35930 [Segetibacter aerophilus]|uniref:Uncharacterized protein n=1 Tax=Segetibacter aerophilus TaxID=670293 RepID=A0A512BH05_9BACT|nr:hypothetical protein SAE01_35930 [Segetibacter aerophilus]
MAIKDTHFSSSGRSVRKDVLVRIQSWALNNPCTSFFAMTYKGFLISIHTLYLPLRNSLIALAGRNSLDAIILEQISWMTMKNVTTKLSIVANIIIYKNTP